MDCAKGINFVITNGGKFEDYSGYNHFTSPLLPSIGIPTTAGTGSEAQSYAVVAHADTHEKRAYGGRGARFGSVVLDPKLCLSMPMRLTAICGIDAISHVFESFVSTRRSPVSQMLGREAWRTIHGSLERALMNPEDLSARGEMLWGAHFAGGAIENSMLGAAHATANPITARFDIAHGMAVGLMLPHVIKFNASVCNHLYEELAQTVGLETGRDPANLLVKWLRKIKEIAGLPVRLRDLGLDHGALPTLAREAATQWTGRFNPKPVGEAEFLSLYEGAF
jgi:alcohol dehydrogenase